MQVHLGHICFFANRGQHTTHREPRDIAWIATEHPLQVGDANDPVYRHLIEDVGDAVAALVEIIKTYQSKGKLSQVLMSTLFKRRKSEAEAAMDEAIRRLQVRRNSTLNAKKVDSHDSSLVFLSNYWSTTR